MYSRVRRVGLVSLVLVAGAALVSSAASGGSTAPGAVRIVDRTFICAISPRGGLYVIDARAHSGTRVQRKWAKLPYAGLRSGNFGGASGNMLAWVTSGKPTSTTTIDQDFEAFDVRTFGTVGVRREACRATRAPIRLTSAGVKGGVAPPLGDEYECVAPHQVVVRIRAVLAAAGRLKQGDDFLTTHVPVLEAKLAVRTSADKPLAYGEVVASGNSRLFVGPGCTAD